MRANKTLNIMKRFLLSLLLLTTTAFCAKAMSYEEARQQAWFLTDKMAYELNLTPEQYDRAYQVNLDYFMSINSPTDYNGRYWNYRDADLRCILFDWQYSLYSTLDYFFRPIRWVRTAWYYPIFDRYRHGYYYFDRPKVYVSYYGGMWRRRGHNDRSPYWGMTFRTGGGMRDHYHSKGPRPPQRPDYNHRPGNNYGRPNEGHNRPDNNHGRPDSNRPSRPTGNYGRPDNSTRPGYNGRPSGSTRPSRNMNNNRSSGRSEQTKSRSENSQNQPSRSSSSHSARKFGR